MSLRVRELEGRRALSRFIDIPFRVLGGRRHPQWAPPLRLAVADALGTRNPFYRNAERALFVAERDGRAVGRIAAIRNGWHNEHHDDRVGFFGFFECVDDAAVAHALCARAEGWLYERGLEVARGPISPSMNHECGLLVEGCDGEVVALSPWNPDYYAALLEGAGYDGVEDLLAYHLPMGEGFRVPERLDRIADRVLRSTPVTFRDADFRRFEEEARRLWPIYREAWEGNWGFVPPDWPEFRHLAEGLKPLLFRTHSFIAEAEGEPVGFMLVVGDINQLLRRWRDGRLWPWRLVTLLRRARHLDVGRVILLGLRDEYRSRGLFPVLVREAMRRGAALGVQAADCSWVLESNHALRRPLEALELDPYRRWRIYEKSLAPPSPTEASQ